jgi:hypothetical protein
MISVLSLRYIIRGEQNMIEHQNSNCLLEENDFLAAILECFLKELIPL